MDIKVFTKMLKDPHFTDYKKMKYKYSESFDDFIKTLSKDDMKAAFAKIFSILDK